MISPVKIWRRQKYIRSLLGMEGIILTWTIIYTPGYEYKKNAPFTVAMVKLENGEKITAPVVDHNNDELRMGKKVKVILRKIRESGAEDILVYGIKLQPI